MSKREPRPPATPQRRLQVALLKGDERGLAWALADGADPEQPDENGTPPLLVAVKAKNIPCAAALMAAGADPNRSPSSRFFIPALMTAACDAEASMVELLLGAGADPNLSLPFVSSPTLPSTPLTMAARDPDCVRLLLAAGAKPLADTAAEPSPLCFCVVEDSFETAEILLALRPGPSELARALCVAAEMGSERMARRLAAAGADPLARPAAGHSCALERCLARDHSKAPCFLSLASLAKQGSDLARKSESIARRSKDPDLAEAARSLASTLRDSIAIARASKPRAPAARKPAPRI